MTFASPFVLMPMVKLLMRASQLERSGGSMELIKSGHLIWIHTKFNTNYSMTFAEAEKFCNQLREILDTFSLFWFQTFLFFVREALPTLSRHIF